MKQYQIIDQKLKLTDLIKQECLATQIRIKVKACSLNYRDIMVIQNEYGNTKNGLVPLSDCAGEIIEVGRDVKNWKVGNRVMPSFLQDHISGKYLVQYAGSGLGGGSYDGVLREEIICNANAVVEVPEHLSYSEAACLPCAGVTAYNALFSGIKLATDASILILGSGGVSCFATQIAHAAGFNIIATSSSDEKLHLLKKLGAKHLINYSQNKNWEEKVIELTNQVGVDLVVEVGGAGTFEKSLKAVAAGGQISMVGILTGTKSEINLPDIYRRKITVKGMLVGSCSDLAKVANFFTEHKLQPVIDQSFDFADAPEAYALLKSAKHSGKVVITL